MFFLTESTQHLRRLLISQGAAVGALQSVILSNREKSWQILEKPNREKAVLVGSVSQNAESFWDLLGSYRALRDNRYPAPTLIIPYLAYTKFTGQAKTAQTSELLAELLRNLNPHKLVILDAEEPNFSTRLGGLGENVSLLPALAARLTKECAPEIIMPLSSDSQAKAKDLAALLEPSPLVTDAIINGAKNQSAPGSPVLIFAHTLYDGAAAEAAIRAVSKTGARRISLSCVHCSLDEEARDRLLTLPIQEIITTNSLPQPRQAKLKIADISGIIMSWQNS